MVLTTAVLAGILLRVGAGDAAVFGGEGPSKLEAMLREMLAQGKAVMPHPDALRKLGER